ERMQLDSAALSLEEDESVGLLAPVNLDPGTAHSDIDFVALMPRTLVHSANPSQKRDEFVELLDLDEHIGLRHSDTVEHAERYSATSPVEYEVAFATSYQRLALVLGHECQVFDRGPFTE